MNLTLGDFAAIVGTAVAVSALIAGGASAYVRSQSDLTRELSKNAFLEAIASLVTTLKDDYVPRGEWRQVEQLQKEVDALRKWRDEITEDVNKLIARGRSK